MGLGIVSRSQVLTKGLPFATWSSGIVLVLGARCKRLISKSCPVPFVPATLVGVVLGGVGSAVWPAMSPMAPIADVVPIPTPDVSLARLEGPVSKLVLARV